MALDFAAFLDRFGTALHAHNKTLSVDILIGGIVHDNSLWNFTALNATTGIDTVANMGTYAARLSDFTVALGRELAFFSRSKAGVGLCPGCLAMPLPDTEVRRDQRESYY
jgi:hypothetical protein|eukprot:COSAG06_NODE_1846_length_8227_cov_10.941683_2_plen_110_part_00